MAITLTADNYVEILCNWIHESINYNYGICDVLIHVLKRYAFDLQWIIGLLISIM